VNIQSTDEVETTALESSDCQNGSASSHHPKHARPHASRKAQFDEIRALYEGGSTVSEISRKLGLGLRRVHRWVCRIVFPERSVTVTFVTPSRVAKAACVSPRPRRNSRIAFG
jgi:hypothetical protein